MSPPVAPSTPSEAGLKTNLVEGQDFYGSQNTITQGGLTLAQPRPGRRAAGRFGQRYQRGGAYLHHCQRRDRAALIARHRLRLRGRCGRSISQMN